MTISQATELVALFKFMADRNDYIGFVSAEGLTGNPDNMHFSAALREFGERYFRKFVSMSRLVPADIQAKYQDTAGGLEHL